MQLVQINLQTYFGGAEAYAATCCRAMGRLGVESTLIVSEKSNFWDSLDLGGMTTIRRLGAGDNILEHFNDATPTWVLTHSPIPNSLKTRTYNSNRYVTGCAHMPLQGRTQKSYEGYDLLYPVSHWVQKGLLEAGLSVWTGEPLYGIADISSRGSTCEIKRSSKYGWDLRKGRDRLFSVMAPIIDKLSSHPTFNKKPGLTLGIVSRITPIKQFPLLFSKIAPVLARHPDVNLEIFGSGGFASIRDLHLALRPCVNQVRFWGHQRDVKTVYRCMDYLLPGLPEKEAFPLNVVEAQMCGVPVLAVNAPPFTEGVIDQQTGYLFRDPREDNGADFERVLLRAKEILRPDPRNVPDHLAKFGFDAFVNRLRPVVTEVERRLG